MLASSHSFTRSTLRETHGSLGKGSRIDLAGGLGSGGDERNGEKEYWVTRLELEGIVGRGNMET